MCGSVSGRVQLAAHVYTRACTVRTFIGRVEALRMAVASVSSVNTHLVVGTREFIGVTFFICISLLEHL
jgi:hypothetical protein